MPLDDSQRSLDYHQRGVVESREQALLVIAGAGAGKTHTLIERTAARMQDPDEPIEGSRICLLTFSRKACSEISERIETRINNRAEAMPRVMTYHAFGYELIRREPSLHHRSGRPTLMDEGDQRRMFNTCARDAGLSGDALKTARSAYDYMRNHGLDARKPDQAERIRERFIPDDLDADTFLTAAGGYEDHKEASNVLDFNDLQTLPCQALSDHPVFRAEVSASYDEIIIDEAQDTNLVQYQLIQLIAGEGENRVVMVGDDDQSIYAWRGAAPENLNRFEKDFNPERHYLGANYRSTPAIVDTAERLVAHNPSRSTDKRTYSAMSAQPAGTAAPALLDHDRTSDAARHIANTLADALRAGASPDEQAVLYRINRLGTQLEPMLIERQIPYQIHKGVELTRRQEVQMAFAAIRLAVNERDTAAFARLAGLVKGFGDRAIERTVEQQQTDGGSLIDIARANANETVAGKWMVIDVAVDVIRKTSPGEMSLVDDWVLGIEPYTEWLASLCTRAEDPAAAYDERLDNLRLFDEAITGYCRAAARNGEPMGSPLEAWQGILELSLTGPQETDESVEPRVTLGTVHKAKGLEWDTVHVLGFADTIMPAGVDDTDDSDAGVAGLEEERRLAYVAMTRARRELTLHHAHTLDLPGQRRDLGRSCFAAEAGLVQAPSAKGTKKQYHGSGNGTARGGNPLLAGMSTRSRRAGPSMG